MLEWLSNPAVQAGAAPFVAGLVVALALQPLRLGGLAAAAAFLVCVQLVSGSQFSPLTVTGKIVVLAMAAPLAGVLVDHAFKPTRLGTVVLALLAGAGALWVLGPVLGSRPQAEAWILGVSAVAACAFLVGFSQLALAQDAVRAGAAALALGVGAGSAAILSASVAFGSYGIALGAGAARRGARLRHARQGRDGAPRGLRRPQAPGGAVPLAVRLPAPERAPVWLQAVTVSLYGLAVAGLACFLAWRS